jgi:hypothetical protein
MAQQKKLWTKQVNIRIKDRTHWARLCTKSDSVTGETYFDLVMGLRNKTPHAHFGINLNQTFRFQEFRKTTHSIGRTVVSEIKGLLENKVIVVDNSITGGKRLLLNLAADGTTGEITINNFSLA